MINNFTISHVNTDMDMNYVVISQKSPFSGLDQNITLEEVSCGAAGLKRAEEIAKFFGKKLEFIGPVHGE